MLHLILGLFWVLLALSIVGIGPALFLSFGRRRLSFAVAVAPATGFVLVTVFGTYLTQLDIPVSQWTVPLLMLGTVVSLILVLLWRRPDTATPGAPEERRVALWGLGGAIFTLAVVVAPQVLGGPQFTTLRGNGTDAFTYISGANYLDTEPLSKAQGAAEGRLLVSHAETYEQARLYEEVSFVLKGRWATYFMLAFSSRVAQVQPYAFEYTFSLLCFLLAYGPAFLYALVLGLKPSHAALSAAAICVGFWAQLILDMRAQSQLNSIPIMVLLFLLISGIEEGSDGVRSWPDYALTGITIVALTFLYPEIMPLVALALLIYFVMRFRSLGWRTSAVRMYGLTGGLALLGCLPQLQLLIRTEIGQMSSASSGRNDWHLAYFSWLYTNPPAGFWGFGPLEPAGTLLSWATSAMAGALGVALTMVFVLALVRGLKAGGPALRLAACVSISAFAEFVYLSVRDQRWAAGKGLSFGYMFFTLCLIGYVLAESAKERAVLAKWPWRKWAGSCALLFLFGQVALGLYRPVVAVSGREFNNYIHHHGGYRQHSWDVGEIQKVLDDKRGVSVWMDIPDKWVSEYFYLVLGSQVKLFNIAPDRDIIRSGSQPPQYLIMERTLLDPTLSKSASGVVARTPEFYLLASGSGTPRLASIRNPNNLENTPDGRVFFWMGGDPTVFSVISFTKACAAFTGDSILGPSSDLPYRTLLVGGGPDQEAAPVVAATGKVKWLVALRAGVTDVAVAIKERATRSIPTDARPLMLRMDNLTVSDVAGWQCGAAGSQVETSLESIANPNGVETAPGGRPFVWMGGKPTVFSVVSSADGCVQFSADAAVGPSSGLPYRTLLVGGGTNQAASSVVAKTGRIQWTVPVQAGVNQVSVGIKEEATQFLPSDPRPLMLRLDNVKVEGHNCKANSR
jgi:hypothetical protein